VESVSVIVITKNEKNNITDCLSTVSWAREIVVVDAGSTDSTVADAQKFTKNVFVRPWEGYGAAKNFALKHAASEWIFWLDADERVSSSLRDEIQNTLASGDESFVAYSVPRKANFLGRWILHCGWYPGRVVRLFRRLNGRFTEERVHERLEIQGRIGELKSDLLHYTDPNLRHYFEKFNKYTTLAAEELIEERRTFRLSQLTLRPIWVFVKMYFLKLGFLDGIQGFILCVVSSCYVFVKYAKLWERQDHQR
jgi:glycosyltransferase involved in cell wall biosynthesis